ncbi:hypothetical protein [Candidatus Entotheonella palauensis]|uniref:hypothetical protein n=1 Tax=Candidatus Entotheonella palauensis TaxID=93172 RepID=UPI000B7CD428|nr:hypothetical protein [Candidatus Entotheonella palauensis]
MESNREGARKPQALTIARHICLNDIIEDLEIIAATPEAAHLYGYDKPSELIGKYLSETLSIEDMFRGYLMSTARLKGNKIAKRYATRIERPDGQVAYVFKQTTPIERPHPIHYLTFLEAAEETDMRPIPDASELNLTQAEVDTARSYFTVRKLRGLMTSFGIDSLRVSALTPSEMQSILTVFQSRRNPQKGKLDVSTTIVSAPPGEPVAILPGQTRQLPDGKFLHRCAKCLQTWNSVDQEPRNCPRTRKDRRGPRCGVRTWRQYYLWDQVPLD